MRTSTSIFASATCVLLTACAANWYAPPAGGATATLRVTSSPTSPFFIWTREITTTCSRDSPNFPVLGPTSKPGQFGNFTAAQNRFEGPILAGTQVRLGVMGSTTASANPVTQEALACNYNIAFTPQPGARYDLRFDFTTARCDVALTERRHLNGTESSVPVAAEVERVKKMCPDAR
jgi:hypothetical protein